MTKIADIRRANLQMLVDRHGLTVVAKRVKRSTTQINDTLAGRKSFGEKVARGIEKEWGAGLPPRWLDVDPMDHNTEPAPDLRGKVPLISWVAAGNWCEAINNFQPGDAEAWLAVPRSHGKNTFALRVKGVSMEPKYRDGSIIFVDPDIQADHLKNVVVRLENEAEATFKQLVVEGGKKYLRALNPDWPDKLIPINGNAIICGVVIGQFIED